MAPCTVRHEGGTVLPLCSTGDLSVVYMYAVLLIWNKLSVGLLKMYDRILLIFVWDHFYFMTDILSDIFIQRKQ